MTAVDRTQEGFDERRDLCHNLDWGLIYPALHMAFQLQVRFIAIAVRHLTIPIQCQYFSRRH
jgi:hypothetical protein